MLAKFAASLRGDGRIEMTARDAVGDTDGQFVAPGDAEGQQQGEGGLDHADDPADEDGGIYALTDRFSIRPR